MRYKLFNIIFIYSFFFCNSILISIYDSISSIFWIGKAIPLIFSLIIFLVSGQMILTKKVINWLMVYLGFIFFSLLSALFGIDLLFSLKIISIYISITLPFVLFFLVNKDSTEFINFCKKHFGICYLIWGIFFIVGLLTKGINAHYIGWVPKGLLVNSILFGITLLIIGYEKKFMILFISIISLTIFFSMSVKALLLITMCLFLSLLIYRKLLIPIIILTLVFYMIFIYFGEFIPIVSLLFDRFFYLVGFETSDYAISDIASNIRIRTEALKIFLDNPLLGIGLENERSIIGTQAHSGFISILIGTGIFGLASFIFYPLTICYYSFVRSHRDICIILFLYLFYCLMNPVYSNFFAVLSLYFGYAILFERISRGDDLI